MHCSLGYYSGSCSIDPFVDSCCDKTGVETQKGLYANIFYMHIAPFHSQP